MAAHVKKWLLASNVYILWDVTFGLLQYNFKKIPESIQFSHGPLKKKDSTIVTVSCINVYSAN